MKNILYLTWKESNNNGTNLQSLALYYTLKKSNNIDILYNDPYLRIGHLFSTLKKKKAIKKGQAELLKDKRDNVASAFKDAKKVYVKKGILDRHRLEKEHDIYLVGSDQLWNPYFLSEVYLLNFVKSDKIKKVSYGTSLGINAIPDEFKNLYRKRLSKFHHISMREISGVKAVSELINKHVDRVLDPVFLLTKDEWIQFSLNNHLKTKLPDKYILAYFVGNEINHWEEVLSLSKSEGLPIVILPMNKWDLINETTVYEAGPKEFVHLINKADKVYTDSLHGLMMSIIFNKQIKLFDRFKNENRSIIDTRISDFLDLFSINDTEKINYKELNKSIEKERRDSLTILDRIINE